jgi:hypothetical protein
VVFEVYFDTIRNALRLIIIIKDKDAALSTLLFTIPIDV